LPASPLLTRGYLLAYFRISFCARHTLRMRIPSLIKMSSQVFGI